MQRNNGEKGADQRYWKEMLYRQLEFFFERYFPKW